MNKEEKEVNIENYENIIDNMYQEKMNNRIEKIGAMTYIHTGEKVEFTKLEEASVIVLREELRLKNLVEKQQKEIEELKENNKKYKKALLYVINQFAYDEKRYKEENELLYTGGLSTLEEAFDVLNIEEGITRKEIWRMIQELLEENNND